MRVPVLSQPVTGGQQAAALPRAFIVIFVVAPLVVVTSVVESVVPNRVSQS